MGTSRRRGAKPDDGRVERKLARAMTVAGERKEPGETVRLRPDQVERLEPEGYFEGAPERSGGKNG